MTAIRSSADVVATLDEQGLLSGRLRKEIEEELAPRFSDPATLIEELVRRGWLPRDVARQVEQACLGTQPQPRCPVGMTLAAALAHETFFADLPGLLQR